LVKAKDIKSPLFGRCDPSAREILDDLMHVRRCMRSGGVLILVGAKHLYESSYDPLNRHYSIEVEGSGENKRFYTSLTMNGHTTIFPIHPTFSVLIASL
jgi:hypothetical protein